MKRCWPMMREAIWSRTGASASGVMPVRRVSMRAEWDQTRRGYPDAFAREAQASEVRLELVRRRTPHDIRVGAEFASLGLTSEAFASSSPELCTGEVAPDVLPEVACALREDVYSSLDKTKAYRSGQKFIKLTQSLLFCAVLASVSNLSTELSTAPVSESRSGSCANGLASVSENWR
jgi:hypothetical protein